MVLNSDSPITRGWKIVQRMLTRSDMTLSEAQSDIKALFGNDYHNHIWTMLCQINDLDPSEFEEKQSALMKEVERNLALSARPSISDLQSPKIISEKEYPLIGFDLKLARPTALEHRHKQEHLAQWMENGYGGITIPFGYQIFSIRCFVRCTLLLDIFHMLTNITAWL